MLLAYENVRYSVRCGPSAGDEADVLCRGDRLAITVHDAFKRGRYSASRVLPGEERRLARARLGLLLRILLRDVDLNAYEWRYGHFVTPMHRSFVRFAPKKYKALWESAPPAKLEEWR